MRNKQKVQRYEWEDALIQAQTDGTISNGALLVALKLSKAINWAPKRHKEPGLYWKNEDALAAVGCGRSTYFKHRGDLFKAGFFVEVKQNLIPRIPVQSTVETNESTVETTQSTVETEQSTGGNPFSVDTLSVDTCSEDALSEQQGEVADAPSHDASLRASGADKNDHPPITTDDQPSFISEGKEDGAVIDSEEGAAESTVWTNSEGLTLRQQMLMTEEELKKRRGLVYAGVDDDSDEWI